jgi:hypothetical protein
MEKGFTKCPNGHYYDEKSLSCPYCHNSGNNIGPKGETVVYSGKKDGNNTRFIPSDMPEPPQNGRTAFVGTVIGKDGKPISEPRIERKLVGWLVTYSFDKMGVDFRLYEGRNIIGRDVNCNITVHDQMISAQHASILFKNDKYKIKDELSSHGTWVNGKDIDDESVELKDNDSIRLGETVFKFKSSF